MNTQPMVSPGGEGARSLRFAALLATYMQSANLPLPNSALRLIQGSLSSQLWAERPYTASLIESNLAGLRDRLLASGLNVGDLDCHLGIPPQGAQTKLEQRWVDETA